jgi:carboxylesterase
MPTGNPNLHNPEYDGNSFVLEGSSTGVLLFHGFTATTLEVRGLAEYIHTQAGFTVAAPLLPGHGTSPEDLATRHFQEWLDAAENAFTSLRSTSSTVFVGGESMGGLLALYLAANHPEIVGILLFAPALIIHGLLEAKLLKWFIFGSSKNNLEKPADGFLPWQGYSMNPLQAVSELGKLQSFVRKILIKVSQPAIIFQGDRDETIDPKGINTILQSISSTHKQLIAVENCGHCVLLDVQHPRINQLSLQFIQQVQSTSTSISISENQ